MENANTESGKSFMSLEFNDIVLNSGMSLGIPTIAVHWN